MVALFVVLTILLFLTIDYFVQRAEVRHAVAGVGAGQSQLTLVLEPQPVKVRTPFPIERIPRGVFFDSGHTWVQLEPSGKLRLGADMLPVTVLGDLQQVEVQPVGTMVRKGEPVVTLRRGERAIILRAPVDGVIEEINPEVQEDPSRLRHDPFNGDWLCRLSPKRLAPELKRMFVGEEAVAWMRRELLRLRDFLAPLTEQGGLAGATLQDGGLPIDGLADLLDDQAWAKFVDEFFVPEA
jgi:glycine cleavage system H protein